MRVWSWLVHPMEEVVVTDWKRRPRHCGRVAKTQVALLTLGPEDVVEKVALEASLQKAQGKPPATCGRAGDDNTVHRTCQEAPLKPFRAQDWHSQCSKKLAEAEERLVRFRAEVELEGQRKSSVLSHVVASHPSSLPSKQFRWYKNAPPNDELAAKKFHRLPKSSRSGCEASGIERRSGNGTSINCCGTQHLAACSKLAREREFGMECGRIGEAAHKVMPAFGQTAFGQTAFGQFWCFHVLAKFLSLLQLVVVVGPVVACCCLLVPVGAGWCLLVVLVGGACWCCCLSVCGGCVQDFWASPPDPPPQDRPSPGPPKISLFFFSLPPPVWAARVSHDNQRTPNVHI